MDRLTLARLAEFILGWKGVGNVKPHRKLGADLALVKFRLQNDADI